MLKAFIETLRGKEHELILEEEDVLDVLKVVNEFRVWYVNQKLSVDTCGWEDEPTKWAIYFNATSLQWCKIFNDLTDKGFSFVIKDYTGRIFLIRE